MDERTSSGTATGREDDAPIEPVWTQGTFSALECDRVRPGWLALFQWRTSTNIWVAPFSEGVPDGESTRRGRSGRTSGVVVLTYRTVLVGRSAAYTRVWSEAVAPHSPALQGSSRPWACAWLAHARPVPPAFAAAAHVTMSQIILLG